MHLCYRTWADLDNLWFWSPKYLKILINIENIISKTSGLFETVGVLYLLYVIC